MWYLGVYSSSQGNNALQQWAQLEVHAESGSAGWNVQLGTSIVRHNKAGSAGIILVSTTSTTVEVATTSNTWTFNGLGFKESCPLFVHTPDLHGSSRQRSVLMAERDAAGSSARRRRERRLRSFWRHEKLAIQMALFEAMHHSAPRGAWHVSNAALRGQKPDRAGDAAGTEFYAMSEVDELPAAGVRPPSLGEPPGPADKVGRVLQPSAFELPSLDVPVLQMEDQLVDVLGYFSTLVPVVTEQVIEVPKVVSPPRAARTVLCAPQMADQLVEVPTTPGYALAVVAVQTLGWRDARALLEQLNTARPGRDTNTGRRDGG